MRKVMTIAAIALFVAGSSVFACDTCGCKEKKAEGKQAACTAEKGSKECTAGNKAEKKCAEGCTKECCAPKAEESKK